MKNDSFVRSLVCALALAAAAAGLPSAPAGAQTTDLSQVPLGTASSTEVLPNLMFVLDDSGSMGFTWMPDNLRDNGSCKGYLFDSDRDTRVLTSCLVWPNSGGWNLGDNDTTPSATDGARNSPSQPWPAGPPQYAAQSNTVYYNPQITYAPGKDANGVDLPSFGSPWTAVSINPYVSPGTIDLTTQWPEPVFCKNPTDSTTSTSNCRRNGYQNDGTTLLSGSSVAGVSGPFRYSNKQSPNNGTYAWPEKTNSSADYRWIRIRFGGPHYFTIVPREFCSDANLTSCSLQTSPNAVRPFPAFVRYCQDSTMANDDNAQSGISGSTPRCQAKLDSAHLWMRYGNFQRGNVDPAVNSYPGRPNRTDCAARPVCSYEEEMTNFANWLAYYHTRMQTMKTSAGRVFTTMDDRYRIGFVTINASSSARYLKIDKFEPVHKGNWYDTFYAMTPSGSTPLRRALSRVGRHYAGQTDGINSFMPDDPIQYSCQQNFALLTTDGYWNSSGGLKLDGTTTMDNQDNVPETYVNRNPTVTLDGMNTLVTTVTVTTELEQLVCDGTTSNSANFSGNPDTNCNCGGGVGNDRVKQRTRVSTRTLVTLDGVTQSDTTAVNSTFEDITACTTGITSANITLSPNPQTAVGTPTVTTSYGGFSDTLADVAMYYYKNDLRTEPAWPTWKAKNNVPATTKDTATHQHMVTFTLGLGLDGLLNYRPDYETAATGDFKSIKDGVTGCPWAPSSVCNWPQPIADGPTALDDLWHAAVNGRGLYFSAKDPVALQSGLTTALSQIKSTIGAAASSATSTPNITPSDNFIYSSTYRTVAWDGEVIAERVDPNDGSIIPGVEWSARSLLDNTVFSDSDLRTIYTFDPAAGADRLKQFRYSGVSPATEQLSPMEQAFFDNRCGTVVPPATVPPGTSIWPQCGPISAFPTDLAIANDGNNLVNWLRGQKQHEGTYYRKREHTLGDTVNAKPAFVGKPILAYGDLDYDKYKAANAGRTGVLYIAANDGMLHAFHGGEAAVGGGTELWAYVPRMLLPDLYKLAAENYDLNHRYYVDGSPAVMDVFIGGAWKTILVGGLNAGGRGYYALDVTDPGNPKGLWEVCADPTPTKDRQCTATDDNIGYSYGQPVITKDPVSGKWVVYVTSGYNNVAPGDGRGWIFIIDAETGTILEKWDNGVGDTVTPSGLARIAGFASDFTVDNTATILYGGDVLGNMFRFDVESRKFQVIGQAKDDSGKPQSITTRPDVTRFDAGFNVVYFGTGRFLGQSDLQDPATLTPPLDVAYQQTVYAIRDTGADLGDLRSPGGLGTNAKLVKQEILPIDANTRSITNKTVDWSTNNGWFVDLNPSNESPGERVNLDPQLVRGALLVVTNEPNNEACSSGGESFFYQFDYRSGSYIASAPGQVLATKLASALAAGFVVYRLPSGQLKYTGIDITGAKKTGGVNPGAGGAIAKRVSWRELF